MDDGSVRVLTFFACFSLAYIATTLGITGGSHLVGHRTFRQTVRRHELVPASLAGTLAMLAVAVELALAAVAVAGLASGTARPWTGHLAAGGGAALGLLFLAYLWRLLGSPAGGVSCGCSPFAGETTRLSLLPAGGIALAGLLGFIGMLGGGAASLAGVHDMFGGLGLLAAGWGVTLAGLVLLSPEGLRADAAAERETRWTV